MHTISQKEDENAVLRSAEMEGENVLNREFNVQCGVGSVKGEEA